MRNWRRCPGGASCAGRSRGMPTIIWSREGGKVRSVYKGKVMPAGELRRYQQAKERRAKVRRSLSQLKKQIRYLKGALRGKEEF